MIGIPRALHTFQHQDSETWVTIQSRKIDAGVAALTTFAFDLQFLTTYNDPFSMSGDLQHQLGLLSTERGARGPLTY